MAKKGGLILRRDVGLILCLLPLVANAQQRRTPATAERVVFERSAQRWLYAPLKPEHTPLWRSEGWRALDSSRASPAGGRLLYVTIGAPGDDDRLELAVDGNSRTVSSRYTPRPTVPSPWLDSNAIADLRRSDLVVGPVLRLPDGHAFADMRWREPFALRRSRRDSVHERVDALGMSAVLDGPRTRTVAGDTVVDGRRLWIVRERATVRYEEHQASRTRTLDSVVTLDRGGTGTLTAVSWFDADSGLIRHRVDSLRIAGKATWHYPGGRVFTTPLRFERWRELRYMTAAEFMVADSVRRVASAKQRGGMVIFTDSLAPREPTDREREASGDTAFILQRLNRTIWDGPVDEARMRRHIATMSDPGSVVRVGLDDDPFYEDIAQMLVELSPVLVSDSTKWPCTPAACRLLAAQYRTTTEPRLREVALVAQVLLDPRQWTDTLLAQPNRPLLQGVRTMARGVGATWPAASQLPMPPEGASARDWLEWMNGVAPAYAELQARYRRDSSLQGRLRFERSHGNAIRFVSARTGRDIAAELRRRYDTAAGDTARLIFGYLATHLTGLNMTIGEVAIAVRSESAVERSLAIQELARLIGAARRNLSPVDSATRVRLFTEFIASESRSTAAPWEALGGRASSAIPREVRVPDTTRFVLVDSVPPAVVARMADSTHFITRARWDARGQRRGGSLVSLTIDGAVGPFVLVRADVFGLLTRNADEAPYGWASGASFVLLEIDGRWRVVISDNWIT